MYAVNRLLSRVSAARCDYCGVDPRIPTEDRRFVLLTLRSKDGQNKLTAQYIFSSLRPIYS